MLRPLYVAILLMFVPLICVAQDDGACVISSLRGEAISIDATDTIRLRLLVSDADAPLIGEGGQGICGVGLSFSHHDATDLNMTLYGPSAESSILVGPAVSTGGGQSIFPVSYDISFVPSTSTPQPDATMMPRWNNNDIGNGNKYKGSYFPFGNNLDQGFSGGVEGVWELVIIDQFPSVTNPGVFREFKMEFCNANLSCQLCEAEKGRFSQDSILICESGAFDINTIYTPTNDPKMYTELPILFSGTAPVFLDEFPLTEGSFDLIVVSIHNDQVSSFKRFARTLTGGVDAFVDLANNPGGRFCMDVTGPIHLQVNQSPGNVINLSADSVVIACDQTEVLLSAVNSVITEGSTVEWKDSNGKILGTDTTLTVSAPGRYAFIIKNNLCDIVDFVDVYSEADVNKVTISAMDSTLTCDRDTIELSVDAIDGAMYEWRSSGGAIAASSQVKISSPGTYIVTRTLKGCVTIDTIIVIDGQKEPVVSVTVMDTLSCLNREVTASVASDDEIRNVIWLKGGVLIGQDSVISLSAPGVYSVDVIGTNGCLFTQVFDVKGDTVPPAFMGIPDSVVQLTCTAPSITLDRVSEDADAAVTMSIDGPPFSIVNTPIVIDKAGRYDLVISSANGCIANANFTVEDLRTSDSTNATEQLLTCLSDSVILDFGISDTDGFEFEWVGGSVEGVSTATVKVRQAGSYTLVATNKTTGCLSHYFVDVRSEMTIPNDIVSGDTSISCLNKIAQIGATLEAGETIEWQTPSGDKITTPNIDASTPGMYDYVITNEHGCSTSSSWLVSDGRIVPEIDLDREYILNCTNPSIDLTAGGRDEERVEWFFADGRIANDKVLNITDTNLDSVRVVNVVSGCSTVQELNISEDKVKPNVHLITGDTTLCRPSSVSLLASINANQERVNVIWIGDGAILGNGVRIESNFVGKVTMQALDTVNGCSVDDEVTIGLTEKPLLGFDLQVIDESCIGDVDGAVIVLEIKGGDGIALFEFNKERTNESSFSKLKPGEYSIRVVDNIGCEVDTVVTVGVGDDIRVSLGADRQANVDEKIVINSQTSGPILDFGWFVNGISRASDIGMLGLDVSSDLEVILQAFSSKGCKASDTIRIDAVFPFDRIDMYIPNAFAPDGSDRNSKWTVSLPETIIAVNRVTIMDRWGGVLREHTPQSGRASVELWDGTTSNGKKVTSGVYTYVCEVTTASEGRRKTFVGTVNVIR